MPDTNASPLSDEKKAWMNEVRFFEYPVPVKYFCIIEDCTFSYSSEYIEQNSLETLKKDYEANKAQARVARQ